MMEKKTKRKFSLLTFSFFLHLFSLFCSAYRDKIYIGTKWPAKYYKEINYWITFFSWWSAQASLVTIIYFIYKLFKKSKNGYFDEVFDLIVINANIISTSVFTVGIFAGITPTAKSDSPVNIFSWKVSSKFFWWFYSVIWHYFAPVVTVVYFVWKKKLVAEAYKKKKLFAYSFIHPLCYFIFVCLRPLFLRSKDYSFSKDVPNYPYPFFEWVGISNINYIFWSVVVIISWLIIFWFSTVFFWWYSKYYKS